MKTKTRAEREFTMTEQEEHGCWNRLPSRKLVLVVLIVIATAMTLVLVHMTGQWVGQRVFTQTYNPRDQVVPNSFEESLISPKGFLPRSRDNRRKNKDWLSKMPSSPRQLLGGLNPDNNLPESMDISSEETFPLDKIFGVSPGRDSPTRKHSRVANPLSGSQTNPASPADALWDTSRAKPIFLNPTSNTKKSLQGTIRKEIIQTLLGTTQKTQKKVDRGNNYPWNDRDPKGFKALPVRKATDRAWKKEDALIFNRVGKCGSRSVIAILEKLSVINHFNLISSEVYNETHVSPEKQNRMVTTLENVRTPYLLQRHLHFVDFTEFNAKQPMYINIIRDPLARFVSSYYFKRFGDGKSDRTFKGSDESKFRSVTDCIVNGYKECVVAGLTYIIPFFCGQLQECRKPSEWALERAKENVENHFVAVGILEDLEGTFRVFEKVVPQFFTGAVKLLLKPDERQVVRNASTSTKFKEKPSEEAATIMKHLMYYEYQFYYFVKDRLEKQMEYYGISRTQSSTGVAKR